MFSTIRTVLVTWCLVGCLLPNLAMAQTQDRWTRSAGVLADADCRLAAQDNVVLLFNRREVLLSDICGYMWWSVKQHFPNGLSAACRLQGTLVGISTDPDRFVYLHTATSAGLLWSRVKLFELPPGHDVHDVQSDGSDLTMYTHQGMIYTSADGGYTWSTIENAPPVGLLDDVASAGTLWVACGTQTTAWSTNFGRTWVPTIAPMEVGGMISQVEEHAGVIWAGGLFGAARFNAQTRSWEPANNGLTPTASLLPRVVELKELGGVLFGIFRTVHGENHAYRWTGSLWRRVDEGGLPHGEHLSRFRLGLCKQLLLVYSSGTDKNFQGVWVVRHDATTAVDEDASKPTLQLSPLPATDRLLIQTPGAGQATITLQDLNGRAVLTTTVSGYQALDVAHLPAGTYVLVVEQADTVLRRMVQKVR